MIDLTITTKYCRGNSTTFPNRRNKLRSGHCPQRLASVVLAHGVFVLVKGVFVLVHRVFVLVQGVLGVRSSFLGLHFSNTQVAWPLQRKFSRRRKFQKSCNEHRDLFKHVSLVLYTVQPCDEYKGVESESRASRISNKNLRYLRQIRRKNSPKSACFL